MKSIEFLLNTIVCITENLLSLFNLFLLQHEILQTLKQKTNVTPILASLLTKTTQQPIQLNSSHVSTSKQPLNAIENSTISKSQGITTIDLSKDDNIINIPKPIVSESEISSENESLILNEIGIATPQKSMLTLVASNGNDLEEIDTVDTNEMSVMNIKITNVTSLPPEVFENVPDVCDNIYEDTTYKNALSLSASKMLTQLATHVSSTKRSMHEGKLKNLEIYTLLYNN